MKKKKEWCRVCFERTYIKKETIPGRPHINCRTSEIEGRDADITKKTCSKCGETSFINLAGSPKDQARNRRRFRAVRKSVMSRESTDEMLNRLDRA